MLAGVLRSNSVLTTLNVAQGDIGDYEREEIGKALLSNYSGKVGYCDVYGLKEGMGGSYFVDLKDKDQIRSKRSFTLFAGLLRANSTLTCLTLSSIQPEHIEVLAEALATNTTMQELKLEQPSKNADTAITTLPVQKLNGKTKDEFIDLSEAGARLTDGTGGFQPCHRHACGVVGAILGASTNMHVRRLKINPGGGADGGAILEHLHRARRSSLRTLDLQYCSGLDAAGLAAVGRCERLASLVLECCPGVGDDGLAHVATGCKRLTSLNLTRCKKITTRGLAALADAHGCGPRAGACHWCTPSSSCR